MRMRVFTAKVSPIKAVRSNLQEALKVAAGNGSEAEKLEASIEADVYESIQHAPREINAGRCTFEYIEGSVSL